MSDSSKPEPRPPANLPQPAPPSFGQPFDLPPPGPLGNQLEPARPEDEVPVYDRGGSGAGRRVVVLTAVIALVVGLGGGFVAGRQTAPKGPATLADAVRLASQGKLPTGTLTPGQGGFGGLFRNGNGQGGPFAGRGQNGQGTQGGQGGAPTRSIQGTVSAIAGNTVTLQTGAGPLQVRIGPSTRIEKAAKGSRTDLAAGNRVMVTIDIANSGNAGNGSVTAATILSQGAPS